MRDDCPIDSSTPDADCGDLLSGELQTDENDFFRPVRGARIETIESRWCGVLELLSPRSRGAD